MKKNVFILMLILLTVNLYAKTPNGDKVDPAIENKFKKEFGSAVKVSWEVVRDISIATYSVQGEEKQVYYFSDGEIFAYGKIIERSLLPESISKSLHAKFNSAIIVTVYQFQTSDSPTRYFIHLATARHSIIVSANDFGDLEVKQKEKIKQFPLN